MIMHMHEQLQKTYPQWYADMQWYGLFSLKFEVFVIQISTATGSKLNFICGAPNTEKLQFSNLSVLTVQTTHLSAGQFLKRHVAVESSECNFLSIKNHK